MVGLLKGGFTLLSVAYETSTVVMDIVLNTEYIKRKWIHEYILSLVFLTLSGVTMGIVGLALETRRPNRYVRNDHLNKTVAFLIGVLQLRVLVETFHVTSANIKKTRRDKELGLTHDEERPNSESGAPSPNGTSANKDLQRLKDGLTYATFVQGIIRDVPVFIIQANATIHYRKWLLVDLWAVCSSGLTLVHAVATYVTKQNEGAFMVAARLFVLGQFVFRLGTILLVAMTTGLTIVYFAVGIIVFSIFWTIRLRLHTFNFDSNRASAACTVVLPVLLSLRRQRRQSYGSTR